VLVVSLAAGLLPGSPAEDMRMIKIDLAVEGCGLDFS
jgi:hypothetical protein